MPRIDRVLAEQQQQLYGKPTSQQQSDDAALTEDQAHSMAPPQQQLLGLSSQRKLVRIVCDDVAYNMELLRHSTSGNQRKLTLSIHRHTAELSSAKSNTMMTYQNGAGVKATWGQLVHVMEGQGWGGTYVRRGAIGWDVRLLRSHPLFSAEPEWTFATAPLRTRADRAAFMASGLDESFQRCGAPVLFAHLLANDAEACIASVTPEDQRMGAFTGAVVTPTTPTKDLPMTDTPSPPPTTAAVATGGGGGGVSDPLEPSRCLEEDLTEAGVISSSSRGRSAAGGGGGGGGAVVPEWPLPLLPAWRVASWRDQLEQWREKWERFQAMTHALTPYSTLPVVEEALHACATVPPEARDTAWILALLECKCDNLIEVAAYSATALAEFPSGSVVAAARQSERALHYADRLSRHMLRVVHRLLRCCEETSAHHVTLHNEAGERFPYSTVRFLLLSLRMRGLRHQAMLLNGFNPKLWAAGAEGLLDVALSDTRDMRAIVDLKAARSRWGSPMAAPLLLAALSGVELVRCLPESDFAKRCALMKQCVSLCAVWGRFTKDARWMPLCMEEVIAGMQKGTPTNTEAKEEEEDAAALRSVRAAVSASADQHLLDLHEFIFSSDEEDDIVESLMMGYTMRQVWSLTAADRLFAHCTRQLRRLQTLPQFVPRF